MHLLYSRLRTISTDLANSLLRLYQMNDTVFPVQALKLPKMAKTTLTVTLLHDLDLVHSMSLFCQIGNHQKHTFRP